MFICIGRWNTTDLKITDNFGYGENVLGKWKHLLGKWKHLLGKCISVYLPRYNWIEQIFFLALLIFNLPHHNKSVIINYYLWKSLINFKILLHLLKTHLFKCKEICENMMNYWYSDLTIIIEIYRFLVRVISYLNLTIIFFKLLQHL